MGLDVIAAKLTGAARYRDILQFRDAGARCVIDFVDAGLPSTVCSETRYAEALDLMLSRLAACNAQVLVAESGASPLEPYNGAAVVERLSEFASQRGESNARIAYAWLLHQPGLAAPIVGASKKEHIEEAVAALGVKLSAEEIELLGSSYKPHPVLGHT